MIKVFEPNITFGDKLSVLKSLFKNHISGTSPTINIFEQKIAEKFDREFAVSVSNGSTALDMSLKLIDLKPDDEVILPSFTIISCLSAVIRSGAKPVFCDVDEESWNMSLENVKQKLTKKTKAVLMVHTYGLTAEAIEISNWCIENNLILIEDAAEAHGQVVDNLKCGSFGEVSTLSFYANKHITTGEGGMILTNNKSIYDKALKMRNLDFSSRRFVHENFYWNYRLSSLQASLGISQIDNLDKVINQKILQGNYYLNLLTQYEDYFQLPLKKFKKVTNQFWVFGIVLKTLDIRDLIIKDLNERGIESRPFFWPLHLQPVIENKYSLDEKFEISERIGKNGLYIPIGSHINRKKQKKIVTTLVECYEKRINHV